MVIISTALQVHVRCVQHYLAASLALARPWLSYCLWTTVLDLGYHCGSWLGLKFCIIIAIHNATLHGLALGLQHNHKLTGCNVKPSRQGVWPSPEWPALSAADTWKVGGCDGPFSTQMSPLVHQFTCSAVCQATRWIERYRIGRFLTASDQIGRKVNRPFSSMSNPCQQTSIHHLQPSYILSLLLANWLPNLITNPISLLMSTASDFLWNLHYITKKLDAALISLRIFPVISFKGINIAKDSSVKWPIMRWMQCYPVTHSLTEPKNSQKTVKSTQSQKWTKIQAVKFNN